MRRRIRLSRWFRFPLFCSNYLAGFLRGLTPFFFYLASLHEIGRMGCNLRVGYILVLAF